MIKSFKHKGLERFFKTGDKSGIIVKHANRLKILLIVLDSARLAISPFEKGLGRALCRVCQWQLTDNLYIQRRRRRNC